MNSIYTLPKLYKAKVLARPSKFCKSPYLADVTVYDEEGKIIEENVMAHSPALGCCGLICENTYVLCTKSASEKNKSKYIIHHVLQTYVNSEKLEKDFTIFHNDVIGVNPMLANPIVKSLLLQNKIAEFQHISELKAEVTVDESRFDFTFLNADGKRVYLEVKNVPLADVLDVTEKERKKLDLSGYDFTKKIGIFPDGYRKNKDEPVSPRALKHVNHLKAIHLENPDVICALVFLIQRSDVEYFKPSSLDPIYQKAVYDAVESGVLVLPLCVVWNNNECSFVKKLTLLPK
jgi:DNA-binding sugar fermentation-stimulating protein